MISPRNPITLIGGGGHALVVDEAAYAEGFACEGFYDDNPSCNLANRASHRHLGSIETLAGPPARAWILAMGDLSVRRRLIDRLGNERAVVIAHPKAFVAPSAVLRPGVFVSAGASVQAFAIVHAHAIINTSAIIEHECEIGENSHIAPGATLGGNVRVGSDCLIGLGARVLPGVRIGHRCVVGAGATVTKDVPEGAVVVGVPARRR